MRSAAAQHGPTEIGPVMIAPWTAPVRHLRQHHRGLAEQAPRKKQTTQQRLGCRQQRQETHPDSRRRSECWLFSWFTLHQTRGPEHLHMDHNRWLAAVTVVVKLNSSGDTVGTEPAEELRPIRLNTGSDLCRHPRPSKLRLLRTRQTN